MTLKENLKIFVSSRKISLSVIGALLIFQFVYLWTPWWRHFVISAADLSQEDRMNLPATIMRFRSLEDVDTFAQQVLEEMQVDGKSLQEFINFIENSGIECSDKYMRERKILCKGSSFPAHGWSFIIHFDEKGNITKVHARAWLEVP